MQPKLLLRLALFFFSGVAGFSQTATNVEPRYLDKPLSEWISLARPSGDLFLPGDTRAMAAVGKIGTNAFPLLLQWLHSDDPNTGQLGVDGFSDLGYAARPEIPDLLKISADWQSFPGWSNAISALASLRDTNGVQYALMDLVALATNPSAPGEVRAQAITGLFHVPAAVPMFIQCLQDKDERVVEAAGHGLGVCDLEPKLAEPVLVACLLSHTNGPDDWKARAIAAGVIGSYAELLRYPGGRPESTLDDLRQAISGAIPVLVKALDDPDWQVAEGAARALGEAAPIEPDVVVPALVKCLNYRHPYPEGLMPPVRLAAIEALGNYGEAARAAVPELTRLVESDPHCLHGASFAAGALKKIVPQIQ